MNTTRTSLFLFFLVALLLCPIGSLKAAYSNHDTLVICGNDEYDVQSFMNYYADTSFFPIKTIIQKSDSNRFMSMGGTPLNAGFTRKYFWTSVNLYNKSDTPAQLMFLNMNSAINQLELFKVSRDTVLSMGTSGDYYPFRHRPYYFNLVVYPIQLQPGERATYYMFLDKRNENFKAGFRLAEIKTFNFFAYREYFVIGILTGILILVMLFNLFLTLTIKDEIHGWYALYVLDAIFLILAFEGMDFQFLYPNHPSFTDLSRIDTCGLNLFLMLLVMRKFYVLKPADSRTYYPAVVVQWLMLALTILSVIVYKVIPSFEAKRIFMLAFTLTALSGIILVVITSVEKIMQGFKPAYFYLFALSFLFIGTFEYIFNLFGLTTTFINNINRIQMGVVVETVIISFGILYRYNLFKREKEKLALELEANKTQTTLQVISTQETERKRIAQDLHDDLGGNLAALKLNMHDLNIGDNQLQPILKLIDRAVDNVRNISHNLMPPDFAQTQLKDLLVNQYRQLSASGPVQFRFHSTGNNRGFDKSDELMIYRVLSELTNNILKHAQATEATIQMVYYDGYLEIMAEDNGKGIEAKSSDGIGLKNIQSRVNYLGGKVNIDTNVFGTTVIVTIPYKRN